MLCFSGNAVAASEPKVIVAKLQGEALGSKVVKWADENPEVFKSCVKKSAVYRKLDELPPPDRFAMAIYGPHHGAETMIVTMNNGTETTNMLRPGGFLVCGPKKEQYVVPAESFFAKYQRNADGTYSPATSDRRFGTVVTAARLRALGASDEACDATTNDDLGVCKIKAPWGSSISLVAGSVLIAEKPGAYYVVDRDTFIQTYEPCDWCR